MSQRYTHWRDVILALITALQSVVNAKWKSMSPRVRSRSARAACETMRIIARRCPRLLCKRAILNYRPGNFSGIARPLKFSVMHDDGSHSFWPLRLYTANPSCAILPHLGL